MARIERTKNAARNIFYGMFLKIYNIAIPFLMRTAMIYLMGVQYLGLNSLFASILSVLNLAELGVGSAMVFSMYKPIAEDDETTICALMKLYRTYYRVIGLVIAVLGCALLPFIPRLIKSDIPAGINIYLLYLLNLGATVLSYWLFAYKNSILTAHQRTDIASKISMVTGTIQYAVQILVLWITRNYYLYVIVAMLTQVLTNVTTAVCADRIYPQFKPRGKLEKAEISKINQRMRDLFTSKIGFVVYDSADTIVISAFLGLTMLAVYQNYYFILNSVYGFVLILFTACQAGIGNSLVVESQEKNFSDFNKFTFIISWITIFCSACLLCLYQPFMKLWVGEGLMLPFSAVVCLIVYFFARMYNQLFNSYKDAAGMWHEDRFRPLVASMTNLAVNLLSVQFIGIYGIVLSTVIAIVCVGVPWLLHNLFSVVFDRKYLQPYLKKLGIYCVSAVLICAVTFAACSCIHAQPLSTLLLRTSICCILPNLTFILLFRRSNEYNQTLALVNTMAKGKLTHFFKILGMKEN